MRPSVRDVAAGKWHGLLLGFGLSERQLSGKHCPCPICGGNDRFRFDDKEGRGTFYCSHCGAGDGIKLVMSLKGLDFKMAAREIEQAAGGVQAGQILKQLGNAEKLERLCQIWYESKPLRVDDEAMRYLAGRGLSVGTFPDCLRLHPALPYFDEGREVGKFPALIARVVGPDGAGLTLHRTYLQAGKKAPVHSPRKLMAGKPIGGGAIRLSPAGELLGIAEGIETALAASALFGCPVWSVVSANGIESFEPPDGVKALTIFADNDANFTGQTAAYIAARRLSQRGIVCEVKTPPTVGDWLDVLNGVVQ